MRPTGETALAAAGLVGIAAYLSLMLWAGDHGHQGTRDALRITPFLVALTLPLARRIAQQDADPWMAWLVMLALAAKLVGTLLRLYLVADLYGDVADAAVYAHHGERLADAYRDGVFDAAIGRPVPGTGFVRVLTALVFLVTGPGLLSGYLVFSWLGFLGLLLFHRAFRVAVPDGDHRRYALLLFLLPSLLFWPSSIGKEAWMMLTLGLAAYGAARLFARRRGAYLFLLLGLGGAALVRPHMTLLVCAGVVVAYVVSRRAGRVSGAGPFARIAGLVALLAVSSLMLTQVERFFGTGSEGLQAAEEVFELTEGRTSTGGSQFTAEQVRSPLDLPEAALSVLFRPLPFDANNLPMLLASMEGTLLLGLFVLWWRRLAGVPREAIRNPYVMFCLVYVVGFVVAFSSFGNFGLLTRQRVQVLPIVLAAVLAVRLPRHSAAQTRALGTPDELARV